MKISDVGVAPRKPVSEPMGWISLLPFLVGIVAAIIAYGRFKLLSIQPRL